MIKQIAILGASGHGKVVAEIAELHDLEVVFFDDAYPLEDFPWKVEGNTDSMIARLSAFDACIVAIGNNAIRWGKQVLLKQTGAPLITLIHPSAVISKYAEIGVGSVVMSNAVINPFVKIGAACIVNTGATIDHDCVFGDAVHISPGANLGGAVEVGSQSWIGIGACVTQCLKIGTGVTVGAGAAVVSDIQDNQTVVGVPAKPR